MRASVQPRRPDPVRARQHAYPELSKLPPALRRRRAVFRGAISTVLLEPSGWAVLARTSRPRLGHRRTVAVKTDGRRIAARGLECRAKTGAVTADAG